MGKHSTPCKYVHHWCHLCSSPGPAGLAVLVLPGAGWGTADCQRAESSSVLTHSLASSSRVGWRGPYGRLGLGEELACWLDTAPCRAWQSPAPEGSPRAIGVMERCPGVSERGLERRKRCFLALELHSWPPPTAIPVPASGEAPILSCSVLSCGWRCVALPARQRVLPPRPLLKWVSWARKSQSSSVGSPPGQGLLQREGRRSPGLCLNTCGGLPLPPAACVPARTHTHTHSNTRMHTHR